MDENLPMTNYFTISVTKLKAIFSFGAEIDVCLCLMTRLNPRRHSSSCRVPRDWKNDDIMTESCYFLYTKTQLPFSINIIITVQEKCVGGWLFDDVDGMNRRDCVRRLMIESIES